jgi:hypothetical protein
MRQPHIGLALGAFWVRLERWHHYVSRGALVQVAPMGPAGPEVTPRSLEL